MLLYIVRHGIAIDREDPKCPSDPERYLTPDGIKRTREVAKSISSVIDIPKVLISSPYVRAVQTAEVFAEALEFSKVKIEKSELLRLGRVAVIQLWHLRRQRCRVRPGSK